MSSALALRIFVCLGLEMSNDELLPNKICAQCHSEIEKFYLFRKKCARSYQRLKAHIQAVKAKEGKENLMFTINSNGSILLNSNLLAGDQPLVTLTKMPENEAITINSETLPIQQGNLQIVTLEGATIDSNPLPDEVSNQQQETQELPNQSQDVSPLLLQGNIVPEENNISDPELSDFLSTMLTELGILTRHGDGLIELGPKTIRNLELETKDGNNITFELVLESDELGVDGTECIIENKIIGEEVEVVSSHKGSTGRSVVKCVECGKQFANRGVLRRHDRNVHKRLTPHTCTCCGKKFAQKEVLRRHVLVHQEKRPYQCDKCPKSFTQRSALESHARLHRPPQDRSLTLHQCVMCSKVFLHASGLSRHLTTHTNKQYPCGECERTFADKSSLRRHQRTQGHHKHYTNDYEGIPTMPQINQVYTQKETIEIVSTVPQSNDYEGPTMPQGNQVYTQKESEPETVEIVSTVPLESEVVPAVSSSDTGG
ncbi:zinc-finger associated domain (zf-AD) domain-containing protein [Phthorimaea operculella]|nr:zinc-finger associated domain (zf-AD) domain-containing protein [Phthorimaea operculella]